MKKILALFAATLLATGVRSEDQPKNASAPTPKPDDVVARVGSTEIKWRELNTAVEMLTRQYAMAGRTVPEDQLAKFRYEIANEMATRELLLQEAKANPPAGVDELVKKQYEQVKMQAGGEEGLIKALGEAGLKLEDYNVRMREGVLIQESMRRYVESKLKITEADTKKFYDENRSKFVTPERVRASHVLIRVPAGATEEVRTQKLAQAKAALSLIKGGEKFADVATKFSEDPGSAQAGGDLRYFTRGQMVKEFEDAAFSLQTDQVSDIVHTQFGYHIIKVTERKPAGERPYDESKEDIDRYLKGTQGQEIAQNHVKELREKTKIEILVPKPADEPAPMPQQVPATAGKKLPAVETKPVPAPGR